MSKTVVAAFKARDNAERAVHDLRDRGFEKEISVLAKDEDRKRTDAGNRHTGTDSITDGAGTGGVLGGLVGLAAGAGALAIPGIGPLFAAGPIAGMLTGAATGGIAGGLADYGVPADRSTYFEDRLKQGHVLVVVRCDDNRADVAFNTLKQYGGDNVEKH